MKDLQRRRQEIDKRLASLVESEGGTSSDYGSGGGGSGGGRSGCSGGGSGGGDVVGARAQAEAAVAAEYQAPRWKQRQENKWAAEAKQAAASLAVEVRLSIKALDSVQSIRALT